MQNLQISYSDYSHNKPTPKTLCRDKLSISSIGKEKPKYQVLSTLIICAWVKEYIVSSVHRIYQNMFSISSFSK